jgi:hypothetical protein
VSVLHEDGTFVRRVGGLETFGADERVAVAVDAATGATAVAGSRSAWVHRAAAGGQGGAGAAKLENESRLRLKAGASTMRGCVLYAFTDNSVASFACDKGTSKTSKRLRQLVRRLRHLDSLLGCQPGR